MANKQNFKSAWTKIQRIFPILQESYSINNESANYTKQEFYEAVNIAKSLNASKKIQSLIINRIEQILRKEIVPEFYNHFLNSENSNNGFKQFYNAVKILYDAFKRLDDIASRMEEFRQATQSTSSVYNVEGLHDALKIIFKSILISQLDIRYQAVVMNFYETALRMEDVNDESGTECLICSQDSVHCNCIHLFLETNQKLYNMSLLEPLAGQTLTNLIYNYIHNHIQKMCKDSFDSSFIASLDNWLQAVIIKWLKKIYQYDSPDSLEATINMFDKKLTLYLYNSYTRIRIDQLFNIIIEYPESLAALEDLRTCLPWTDLKPILTTKLQRAMETRLLHPGVSTPDILTAYVAAIRSLRVLDPSGLLLETVTQPVHQYLRSREDTVRCVVSSLTDEGPNDLAEELIRGEAVQIDESTPIDVDEENWETWVPDPVDTIANKVAVTRRTSDIISMLVNVYGSKELFVNEYRTLLADRLLTQYSCDTEKEIRYLELLKLRFGDSQLHYCEVMLKDIADSKRINQHILQDPDYKEADISMSALIVSAQFWPPFKEEKLKLHSQLEQQMETYTSAFETLKGSRTLCWKNHLGVVELEIELADRTLNLSVSPVHATIMMYFQDKSTWALNDLSQAMACPMTMLRRKISFWQSHGILIEKSTDVFCIQEDMESKDTNIQDNIFVEDYESESAMASAQDQREEELQTFWSYIVGMLMNLDTLPLDRIHQMLKMFAFQGPTIECSLQELKSFLDRKVREHQLIYSNGLYKLPK